jgi:hypothetical protein
MGKGPMATRMAFRYCTNHFKKAEEGITDEVREARSRLLSSHSDEFVRNLDSWNCWKEEDDAVMPQPNHAH